LLQSRAQPQGTAGSPPHAPPGPLDAAGFSGLRHELPRLALPLGLRLHVALALPGDLAADIWVHLHVTHLLSVPLMNEGPGRGRGRAAGMRTFDVAAGPGTPVPADDRGQVQVTQQMAAAARPAKVLTSADAAGASPGERPRSGG
jgi:hypothetical protein